MVVDRTSETPIELPARTPPENAEELVKQFEQKTEAFEQGEEKTLVIDQQLMNALLSSGDINKYVDIDLGTGDTATLMVSAPLDVLEWEKVKGRYFNLIVWASYKYDRGGTEAYIRRLEIPWKELPADLLDELIGKNIGPYFYRDEDYAKNMQKFDSIILSGGKLYVELKEEK